MIPGSNNELDYSLGQVGPTVKLEGSPWSFRYVISGGAFASETFAYLVLAISENDGQSWSNGVVWRVRAHVPYSGPDTDNTVASERTHVELFPEFVAQGIDVPVTHRLQSNWDLQRYLANVLNQVVDEFRADEPSIDDQDFSDQTSVEQLFTLMNYYELNDAGKVVRVRDADKPADLLE